MTKLGFSLQAKYDLPMPQVIELLKKAGFSAVSPVWSPELDMAALSACVKSHGMVIQSVHAPLKNVFLLWSPDDPQAPGVLSNILGCIDDCAQYGVPVMVIHGWQGLHYTFPDTPLDYQNFDRIVSHAGDKGVCVAFENLEGEEYLQALMTRYAKLPHVGFCWDSGHDHCYPHKLDFLKTFGSRLMMTHLNDNFGLRDPGGVPSGNDDLHLLPCDGNMDWEHAIGRLKNASKQTILNFEIKKLPRSTDPKDRLYAALPPEEFFRLAGTRARRIAALYEQIANK